MSKKVIYYGIELTHLKPEKLKLQYVLGVKTLKINSSLKVLEFNRKRFFIDGKEPLRSFDQLAERCIRSIYPIQIAVNKENQIVSAPNLKKMQKRWKRELKLLKMEFKGEVVNRYFQQISKNLVEEGLFLKSVEQDIAYSLIITRPVSEYSQVKSDHNIKFQFPINAYGPKSYFYGSRNSKLDKNGNRINHFNGFSDNKGNLQLTFRFKGNSSFITKVEGSFISKDSIKKIEYRATYLKNRN